MRKWSHKIQVNSMTLESELNAFSEQGYEIYKVWHLGYETYEILAYKDELRIPNPTSKPSAGKSIE